MTDQINGVDFDVEARHAAWIRNLAPAAFNPALTKNQVLAAVGATGFIK